MARGRSLFREALASIAKLKLTPADRAHLARWEDDDRADDIWNEVEARASKRFHLNELTEEAAARLFLAQFFIMQVLSCRSGAEEVDEWPDYLTNAERAEELAKFLKGSGRLPPPMPQITNYMELADSLESAASMIRQQAVRRQMKPSRKNVDGSRARQTFIRMLREDINSLCGQPLGEQVRVLTEIAYDREFEDHHIRRAVRPTTKKGRQARGRTHR